MQEGVPDLVPPAMCHLGGREPLVLRARLVEAGSRDEPSRGGVCVRGRTYSTFLYQIDGSPQIGHDRSGTPNSMFPQNGQ